MGGWRGGGSSELYLHMVQRMVGGQTQAWTGWGGFRDWEGQLSSVSAGSGSSGTDASRP